MIGLLASAASANGNYPSANGTDWPGGTGTFAVWGTFDGATVKLQCLPPGGATWIDVGADVSIDTAAAVGAFQLGPCKVRANIASGSQSSQSLSAQVF